MNQYEQSTVRRAIAILERHASYSDGHAVTSPDDARKLIYLQLAGRLDEFFGVAFLNNRHQLIKFEKLFRGTVDGASVHPRIVVRRALETNAAAVVLAHNHPSGDPSPSDADKRITQRLKDALALVDVRVLDHLIVGSRLENTYSMAEHGLI